MILNATTYKRLYTEI